MSPLLHPISARCPAALPTFQHLCSSALKWLPTCCRPHRNLEAALQAARDSVATLQLEKDVAMSNVKYFLDLCQELKEVSGAQETLK